MPCPHTPKSPHKFRYIFCFDCLVVKELRFSQVLVDQIHNTERQSILLDFLSECSEHVKKMKNVECDYLDFLLVSYFCVMSEMHMTCFASTLTFLDKFFLF